MIESRTHESSEIPAVQQPTEAEAEALRIANECSHRTEEVMFTTTAAQIVDFMTDPQNIKLDTSGLDESVAKKIYRNSVIVIYRALKEGSNTDELETIIPRQIVKIIGTFLLQFSTEIQRETAYIKLIREVGIQLRPKLGEKPSLPPLPNAGQ